MAERRADARWSAPASRIEATIEARVDSVTARGADRWLVLDRMHRTDGGAEPIPRRARLHLGPEAGRSPLADAIPGDRLRAIVRLRPLLSRFDPGTPDPAERLRRDGIGASAALLKPALGVRFARSAPRRALAHARARREAAARVLAAHGAGLGAALALGARSGLGPGEEDALRAAGLSHLLAVSGLNLAMAAALVFAGARRLLLRAAPRALADPRRAALAIAWAAAVGYAALTGFEVSMRRALAFLTLGCVALLLRRPLAPLQVVAAAALLALAAEPAALFDPGAQLSFAAAAALLLARGSASAAGTPASGARASRRERVAALVEAGLRTSATALAATLPIAAWHFGRLAPAALVANLVAVPATELILLPVSLVAALLALAAPGVDWLLAAPAAFVRGGSHALVAFARAASWGPGAEQVTAPSLPALAAAALCGAAGLRARRTSRRVAWMAAAHAALFLAPPARIVPDAPRLVALDVGQGDAIVVQGRRGTLLVDAGSALAGSFDLGRSVVVPALAALGVRRIDVAAASHADLDHRGGLPAVLANVPVARLWLPRGAAADPAFAPLVALARERGVSVEERGAGDAALVAGDLRIEPLWPPAPDEVRGLGDNDRSLVLRVDVEGGARALLPGDLQSAGERALLARGAAVAADVLKLGHHGSRTSSGAAFLAATGAGVALASAPCLGRFGMPHAEVVQRAASADASLWWTGRDGALVVSLARPIAVRGLAPIVPRAEPWRCGGK